MPTATLTAAFDVDGPGEDMELALEQTAALTVSELADVTVPITSTTETTVWQSKNHANGSAFTPEHSTLMLAIFAADGQTLIRGTDVLQIGYYTTPVAGGSATHRVTKTCNAGFFFEFMSSLLWGAASTVPSGTALTHMLTKITAAWQTGASKTMRAVVKASN